MDTREVIRGRQAASEIAVEQFGASDGTVNTDAKAKDGDEPNFATSAGTPGRLTHSPFAAMLGQRQEDRAS